MSIKYIYSFIIIIYKIINEIDKVLSDKEKEICGNLVKKFDAVSVREPSGIQVFDNFTF